MDTKTKDGPKTKKGKQVSSRSAISHGLKTKKKLNPKEKENY